jgi:hypothetical protein
MKKQSSALATQVGGTHYKSMPIQPAEYCQANRLNYLESAVVKYVSRWKEKGGESDIQKAIHCLELLLEVEKKLGFGSKPVKRAAKTVRAVVKVLAKKKAKAPAKKPVAKKK